MTEQPINHDYWCVNETMEVVSAVGDRFHRGNKNTLFLLEMLTIPRYLERNGEFYGKTKRKRDYKERDSKKERKENPSRPLFEVFSLFAFKSFGTIC
jgi:hypothetical protein